MNTPSVATAAATIELPPHLDPDVIMPTLLALMRWGFHVEQPDAAIVPHSGASLTAPATANRRYSLIPEVGGWPVLVVDVVDSQWDSAKYAHGVVLHPDELDCLHLALDSMGFQVVERWNGHPTTTGSLRLAGRQAHPSLLAAVKRYHAGCPDHPAKGLFCDCGWYQAGHRDSVQPVAPEQS
ncbi:hypothetical protein [Saccharothrix sp. HUAS TT1]|uniref:hypothetical protein n=1 Tax=unclassified Saccharothrix TaxID=2593673 RepID=UPI00345B9455